MGTGTVKGSLQLFGIIAVGAGVFGLLEGYGIGETLIAAVILSAFVVGIACPPFLGGRLQRLPRRRGRSARLGAGVAPEALSPGSPREATMVRRAEAGTAVVAGADLRLAEAATPYRPRHADIARNDLSKSLYSDPRRAEETADGASADGAADAASQGRQHKERTGTDRRYGLHPRTASRG